MISEETLTKWSRELSETENQKCKNAFEVIESLVKKEFGNTIDIYKQGSYANHTNVRQDSDVDIVVEYKSAYYYDISLLNDDEKAYHLSLGSHPYSFHQFKNDLNKLLADNFPNEVHRKHKCVRLDGNTYRVNADVVPCFKFKRFSSPYRIVAEGIQLYSDDVNQKGPIRSFPKKHIANGEDKNKTCSFRYKRAVRIIKNCRNYLEDNGKIVPGQTPSFFLESLIWNLESDLFSTDANKTLISNVLNGLWRDAHSGRMVREYREVSDMDNLFGLNPKHNLGTTKSFIQSIYHLIYT